MSKYYEIDKPFSRENWNTLIRDLNEFFGSPPNGCPDIEPLEEVEPEHIWTRQDVEEVRAKLGETCPGINFSEELEIWRPGIIDEIEQQMENIWCECGETEPEIIECGNYSQNILQAGAYPDRCCGQITYSHACGCDWCSRLEWEGDYYEPVYDSNRAITDALRVASSDIDSAFGRLSGSSSLMIRYAGEIVQLQVAVDKTTASLDIDIAYYEAHCQNTPPPVHPPDCPSKKDSIDFLGWYARYFQDKLDDKLVQWNDMYSKMLAAIIETDDTAAVYWSLALQLEGRYPDDVNVISDCFDSSLQGLGWIKAFNPYRDTNATSVMPEIRAWVENEVTIGAGRQSDIVSLKVSPNGTPYSGTSIALYNRRYTLTYVQRRGAIRNIHTCEWLDWGDLENVYYYDTGVWIWAPLPAYDLSLWGVDTIKIRITESVFANQDNTDKQNEWYDTFLNWYDEHPQYDDRHENY